MGGGGGGGRSGEGEGGPHSPEVSSLGRGGRGGGVRLRLSDSVSTGLYSPVPVPHILFLTVYTQKGMVLLILSFIKQFS